MHDAMQVRLCRLNALAVFPGCRAASDAQILRQQRRLGVQFGRAAFKHHFALDQDDVAVGDLGDVFPVLVDDDAADAAFTDHAADAPDLAGDQRLAD